VSRAAVRIPAALALVCVAGAALRFATLDVQSLWYDEAVTAQLLRLDLGGLLHAIPDSESSPPLYYVLAWLWTHVFGTGEVGLRSFSALLGTATIPVVWALGRRLGGERAGLVAAAIVAVNPLLVWFSQEARAYALLVLLAALATLWSLRALEQPRPGRAAAWGIVAALAVATHYYAIFLVAPQALWLVARLPSARARAAALAPLAIALAALAPLALGQRANDSAAFIGDSALGTRILQVPKQLLVGYDSPAETLLAVLSAIVLVVALAGLRALITGRTPEAAVRAEAARPGGPAEAAPRGARAEAARPGANADAAPPGGRDEAVLLTALAAAALVLPALAALAGEDHLITRNLLAAAPAGAALVGAGLVQAARRWPAVGPAAIATGCVLGVAAVIGVAIDPRSQRDDWRGAVAALGRFPEQRLIAATPASALAPLRYYLPGARPLTEPAVGTREIDYVAMAERTPGERPKPPRPAAPPPIAGFELEAGARAETFTVLRLRAGALVPIAQSTLGAGLNGRAPLLVVFTR
jgi:4-amino-4-deoxy-L-arabinose transferase-like glycosyltransferase